MNSLPLSAVVCAAGAGSRMGMNKALCLLDSNTSFLQNIVETLHAASIHSIFVVIGSDAERVQCFHKFLPVTWVYNPNWISTWMLESLICGLQLVPENHSVLHWPVDCVDVNDSDLKRLIRCDAPLANLVFDGVSGHPMKLSAQAVRALKSNSYATLRDFVHELGIVHVHAQFPALMNCNTPQKLSDYIKSKESH